MSDYKECKSIVGWRVDPDLLPPHNVVPVFCKEYTATLERTVERLAESVGVNTTLAQNALSELRRGHASDHIAVEATD